MKSTIRICAMVALLGLTASLPAHGAETPLRQSIMREAARVADEDNAKDAAAWRRVRNLPDGTRIVVSIRDGARLERRFVKADEMQLTMATASGAEHSVERTDVLEIKTAVLAGSKPNKALFTAIGAAVGAVSGYFLFYDYPRGQKGIYQAVYVGVPIGLGVGAVTGLVLGGNYSRTIYP